MAESPSTATSPTEEEDTVLVQRAKDGDLRAFETLVQRYHSRIYTLTYRMTNNAHDAEDLLQETFVRAHAALPRFEGKSSFYTWIYRIAVNRSINFLKSRKIRTGISLDDPDSFVEHLDELVEEADKAPPWQTLLNAELKKKLNEAIQKLSENHRLVVVMHEIEGIPQDEVAQILGCSSGTVRSRLFYARQQLQAWLSDYVK